MKKFFMWFVLPLGGLIIILAVILWFLSGLHRIGIVGNTPARAVAETSAVSPRRNEVLEQLVKPDAPPPVRENNRPKKPTSGIRTPAPLPPETATAIPRSHVNVPPPAAVEDPDPYQVRPPKFAPTQVGDSAAGGRFELKKIVVSPHLRGDDELTITVAVTANSTTGAATIVDSNQFFLNVDGVEIAAERSFKRVNVTPSSGPPLVREVVFKIPNGTTQATLRISYFAESIQILLDLKRPMVKQSAPTATPAPAPAEPKTIPVESTTTV